MEPFKIDVADRVAKALDLPREAVLGALEAPKDPKRGDMALPCFKLVKALQGRLGDTPAKVAQEIAKRLKPDEVLGGAEAAGPFVNFRLAKGALAASVLKAVARPGWFGGSDEGKGKTVVIDYSSPNIAKPFHLGHLRSTVIGHSLRKLFESRGFKVEGVNHFGDWGTQFGFMMAAWQRWKDEAEKQIAAGEGEIDVFVSLYVRINKLAQENPKVRDEARAWFLKLEQGDPVAVDLWKFFIERSKKEFDRIYGILGVKIEHESGESFYNDKMAPVLEKLRAKGLLVRGKKQEKLEEDDLGVAQGADSRPEGVDLGDPEKGGLGFVILVKADGATTYATRDLAAAFYREDHWHPARIVYVVGAPQILHFRQLKKVLEVMGEAWQEKIVHVPFGQYVGMKTREGKVVFLDEVLERAREEAIKAGESATKKQDLTPTEIKENARKIGAGAVKFFDLKNLRGKDIELGTGADGKVNLDRLLNPNGETGPYVQFSYARLSGVLRKLDSEPTAEVDFGLLSEEETLALVRAVGEHPDKVRQAIDELEPSVIVRHVLEVAKAAHSFLHVHRVKDAEPPVRAARALLVSCARKVVGQCLELLGIEPLEKM